MPAPQFVTFTDARTNESIRVSTQAPIAALVPFTLDMGKLGTISVATLIVFESGAAQAVSGSVTTTAAALGVAAVVGPGVLPNTPQGTVALSLYGTDAVSAVSTYYWAEGFNPVERTVTNLAMLNGTTSVGTDSVIHAIWDSTGAVLGWTTLAGTLAATADVFQSIALVTPIVMPAGRVFAGFIINGTTSPHQTIAANTYPAFTGTTAGVFGSAVPVIVPSVTTTANVGPFWRMS